MAFRHDCAAYGLWRMAYAASALWLFGQHRVAAAAADDVSDHNEVRMSGAF